MLINKHIKRVALAVVFLASSNAAMAQCGKVQIAEMNWASAEFIANVDKIILEAGYGCNVSLIPGATETTFASMNAKSQPDIAPELWINAVRDPLYKAMDAGTLHSANSGPITGLGEGWWIPPHTAKAHPELKTVLDGIKRPDLFPDKEEPSKGAFIGCPAGWGCQPINVNLFKAFDMENKGWKLINPGSGAGLDGSMTKAVDRGQNWFGYYWSPTALIGKYNMMKLDFGVPFVGSEHWDNCIAKETCDNPKPTTWIQSEVHTVITDKFKKTSGEAVATYLKNRVYSAATMNAMLVYMNKNQASGEDAAIEFLLTKPEVWKSWVNSITIGRIKAAIE